MRVYTTLGLPLFKKKKKIDDHQLNHECMYNDIIKTYKEYSKENSGIFKNVASRMVTAPSMACLLLLPDSWRFVSDL